MPRNMVKLFNLFTNYYLIINYYYYYLGSTPSIIERKEYFKEKKVQKE